MSVIDDYLQQFEPSVRERLDHIRSIAKTVLPDGDEVMAYGMPTIKYKGQSIIGFDAHKKHIGIYPYSCSIIAKIDELKEYSTTKGAIQEDFGRPLPDALIEKIIRERIKSGGS